MEVTQIYTKLYCSVCGRYIKQAGAVTIQKHKGNNDEFLFIHKDTNHLLSLKLEVNL